MGASVERRLHIRQFNKHVLLLILFLLFVLAGCRNEHKSAPLPSSKHESSLPKGITDNSKGYLPLKVEEGIFHSVSGWIDNETILYVTDNSTGSSLYSYNISKGEQTLLYEDNAPIATVMISPTRNHILIHSSPSSKEALITILEKDGSKVLSERVPSSELYLKWNQFHEDVILITAFTEDWDFSVWKLDIEKGERSEITIPQPFAVWIEKDKLAYLDWDLDSPSLTANLKQFRLQAEKSEDFLSGVYHVDSFGELLMTVEPEMGNEQNGSYRFFSNDLKEVYTFSTPHLSRYSDWLVPYFDYNESTNTFLSFQPLYSSEADVYFDGFQLIAQNLETGEKNIIYEGMDNEPLSCSPNGKLCLNGFYYEKLINMDSKEIIQIVEEEKIK